MPTPRKTTATKADDTEATQPREQGVDHAKVQQAQREAGDRLEAQRQERIQSRDNPGGHHNLASALVAFQAEMPHVAKGKTARIPGKNGSAGYSYTYADLADVTDAAVPLLTKHGLAFSCLPRQNGGGGYELAGVLIHALGERMEAALPIAGRQAQDLGSSLTYNRRYLFGCMTGVVTDDDEDGTLAQAAEAAQRQAPPESLPVSESPAVQRLRGVLGELSEAQAQSVRTWWSGQGLPAIAHLDDYQVQAVEGYVREMSGPGDPDPDVPPWEQQGAQDPT